MAYPLTEESTGASIVFTVSGFTAHVMNMRFSGLARRALETTHLRTTRAVVDTVGSETFQPAKLTNPGQLQLDIFFRPDVFPPLEVEPELIFVLFPRAE